MHICFIADANSIHTKRWISPLIERGTRITLVSYTAINRSYPGCDTIDLTKISNLSRLRFLIWGVWIYFYLRRLKPDILHAHQIIAAGWLGAMANYHPFVVSSWGSDLLLEPTRSALRRLFVKIVLNRCDQLIVASRTLFDAAISLGVPGEGICMIPWGIETAVFKPLPDNRESTRCELNIEPDVPVILSPRAIGSLYNIHIILEAFANIQHRFPRSRLLLIKYNVQNSYLPEIEGIIQNRALQQGVIWLPPIKSMDDMARFYRAADITVSIPSSEGYGFTVYEAISCGCPTIISDTNAFEGILQDQVHTIKLPTIDAASLQDAIVRLLSKPELRKNISTNGLQLSKEWDVSSRIKESIKLYNELM